MSRWRVTHIAPTGQRHRLVIHAATKHIGHLTGLAGAGRGAGSFLHPADRWCPTHPNGPPMFAAMLRAMKRTPQPAAGSMEREWQTRPASTRHAYEQNRERIAAILAQTQAIKPNDPADTYLRQQGAWQPDMPAALRFHHALEWWEVDARGLALCRGRFPALVATLQNEVFPHGTHRPAELHTVALQRIYLPRTGQRPPCGHAGIHQDHGHHGRQPRRSGAAGTPGVHCRRADARCCGGRHQRTAQRARTAHARCGRWLTWPRWRTFAGRVALGVCMCWPTTWTTSPCAS